MPDVSCQHMVAVALVRGAVSFHDSHDAALMQDPTMRALAQRVTVVADATLMDPAAPRGAIVNLTTTDGRKLSHHTKHPPGTKENPLSVAGVSTKVRDLMAPVLGREKSEKLIASLNRLESIDRIDQLRSLVAT